MRLLIFCLLVVVTTCYSTQPQLFKISAVNKEWLSGVCSDFRNACNDKLNIEKVKINNKNRISPKPASQRQAQAATYRLQKIQPRPPVFEDKHSVEASSIIHVILPSKNHVEMVNTDEINASWVLNKYEDYLSVKAQNQSKKIFFLKKLVGWSKSVGSACIAGCPLLINLMPSVLPQLGISSAMASWFSASMLGSWAIPIALSSLAWNEYENRRLRNSQQLRDESDFMSYVDRMFGAFIRAKTHNGLDEAIADQTVEEALKVSDNETNVLLNQAKDNSEQLVLLGTKVEELDVLLRSKAKKSDLNAKILAASMVKFIQSLSGGKRKFKSRRVQKIVVSNSCSSSASSSSMSGSSSFSSSGLLFSGASLVLNTSLSVPAPASTTLTHSASSSSNGSSNSGTSFLCQLLSSQTKDVFSSIEEKQSSNEPLLADQSQIESWSVVKAKRDLPEQWQKLWCNKCNNSGYCKKKKCESKELIHIRMKDGTSRYERQATTSERPEGPVQWNQNNSKRLCVVCKNTGFESIDIDEITYNKYVCRTCDGLILQVNALGCEVWNKPEYLKNAKHYPSDPLSLS
jgi:hypothetical protein